MHSHKFVVVIGLRKMKITLQKREWKKSKCLPLLLGLSTPTFSLCLSVTLTDNRRRVAQEI